MTVQDLDFAPRTRGRAPQPVSTEFVRELGPADLALLASERGVQAAPRQKLRDRHHALARCLAQGMSNSEAGAVTGYSPSTIAILNSDPAFMDLIAHYARIEDSLLADFQDRATMLSLTAMNNLQDKLEDEEKPLGALVELEIAKFAADRTGHAPVSKSIAVTVNGEQAARLRAARERLNGRGAIDETSGEP